MRVIAFVAPALQLSTRKTRRHANRVISDVRPHVTHTDFAPVAGFEGHGQAFRVALMSSDLRPRLSSSVRDLLIMCSPLCLLAIFLGFT